MYIVPLSTKRCHGQRRLWLNHTNLTAYFLSTVPSIGLSCNRSQYLFCLQKPRKSGQVWKECDEITGVAEEGAAGVGTEGVLEALTAEEITMNLQVREAKLCDRGGNSYFLSLRKEAPESLRQLAMLPLFLGKNLVTARLLRDMLDQYGGTSVSTPSVSDGCCDMLDPWFQNPASESLRFSHPPPSKQLSVWPHSTQTRSNARPESGFSPSTLWWLKPSSACHKISTQWPRDVAGSIAPFQATSQQPSLSLLVTSGHFRLMGSRQHKCRKTEEATFQ